LVTFGIFTPNVFTDVFVFVSWRDVLTAVLLDSAISIVRENKRICWWKKGD